ncbi:MAG: Ig domain-containing protein [Clostridia bacterium]|nr:Ig domain-containing protein [Clostridia bacterium]
MGYEDATCPDYLVKLTAVEGYALPDNVSVSVSGKELTAGKDYTYTPEALQTETGKDGEHEYNLKVDRHAINGPVVITASAVKPVTGVSLDKTELTLDEGDSATLAATVSPEDASNKNVTWTSSDEKVATVDATGKVTAIKAGTATITVTTEDGEKTATCAVTVNHKHVEEVVPGKAATCTEKGLTDGKKCSVCDAVLEEQEEIPALGHDFKDGKCTRCDAADPDYKPTPVEPVSKFTGLANEADKDGVWWYYTDGKIDKTHTGVDQNKYGWWRVENGKVNFNAQSIYQNENGWWKTTDGKVTFKENSIYQNQYGWWKCKDSKVDFTAQSIYQNQYGWWKTTNGKVTFKENGLFKNQYGTWKVENSKVNFNYNGTYQGKTIKNGKVQ